MNELGRLEQTNTVRNFSGYQRALNIHLFRTENWDEHEQTKDSTRYTQISDSNQRERESNCKQRIKQNDNWIIVMNC